jgi:hypothetical protein
MFQKILLVGQENTFEFVTLLSLGKWGFYFFNFVKKGTAGMSQIWLQVSREDSTNILKSCLVLATCWNSLSKKQTGDF